MLILNQYLEIVGYTAGNDVSCRDIEGENPLFLPQAKIYDDSCAIGPGILISEPDSLRDLPVELFIERDGVVIFNDSTRTSHMERWSRTGLSGRNPLDDRYRHRAARGILPATWRQGQDRGR